MKQPRHALKYTLAVLLLAALTTTEILSATYAKYIISATTPTETARVAKYDVKVIPVNGEGNELDDKNISDVNLDAAVSSQGASVVQYYKVINSSEVAVSYKVVVTLNKALPTGTSVSLADKNGKSVNLASNVTGENDPIKVEMAQKTENGETNISFICSSAAWTLAPGASDEPHTVALSFITDNKISGATSDLTGIGVTVKVVATQID